MIAVFRLLLRLSGPFPENRAQSRLNIGFFILSGSLVV